MRIYMDEGKNILKQVVCNQCGKALKVKNGILVEGVFEGNQQFGYFSNKDGIRHSFDLCEECYDKLIEGFTVEVKLCWIYAYWEQAE